MDTQHNVSSQLVDEFIKFIISYNKDNIKIQTQSKTKPQQQKKPKSVAVNTTKAKKVSKK